jgi:transcriptional regulator with XRE-family HTH domain
MIENELRATLSMNIKRYRSLRSWSQAVLAEKANISVTFLSDIERGLKWPYPETLTNLAKALGIKVFELFKQDEPDTGDISTMLDKYLDDVSISLSHAVNRSIELSLENIKANIHTKP